MPRSRPSRKSWASNSFRPVGRRALRGSPFEIERLTQKSNFIKENLPPKKEFDKALLYIGLTICSFSENVIYFWVTLLLVCGVGGLVPLASLRVCSRGRLCVCGGRGQVPLACLRVCSRGRLCVCGGRCLTPRESGGSSPPVSPPAGSRQRPLPPACGSTPAARRGSPAR